MQHGAGGAGDKSDHRKHNLCEGKRATAAHAEPEPAHAVLDPRSPGQAAPRNAAKSERSEASVQAGLFVVVLSERINTLTAHGVF